MTKLVLIRHGVTEWNKKKIVQGHTDIPLDTSGKQQVSNWILPQNLNNLEILYCANNYLKKLPQSLKNLKELSCHNNFESLLQGVHLDPLESNIQSLKI